MILAALVSGCATFAHVSVPDKHAAHAQVSGFKDVRIDGDAPASAVRKLLGPELVKLGNRLRARSGNGIPDVNFLAISGGAQDGAYGAGIVVGWTENGTIPSFDLVTGVSAGALVAPFAFAGPEFADELQDVFTRALPTQGQGVDGFTSFLSGGAVANGPTVMRLLERHIDDKILDAIASERSKGRLLLIGTTNIETQRAVYWDMGRIAQSKRPDRGDLFRKVLLASASVPGIFDPVVIKVEANGTTYDEVHVDGGTTRGVFLAPLGFSASTTDSVVGTPLKRNLYIIRNGKVTPERAPISGTTLSLVGRAVTTLIKYRGNGDLYRLYARAIRDRIDYNLAFIPPSYASNTKNEFDIEYLRELFAFGRDWGLRGYPWHKLPPGFDPNDRDDLTGEVTN